MNKIVTEIVEQTKRIEVKKQPSLYLFIYTNQGELVTLDCSHYLLRSSDTNEISLAIKMLPMFIDSIQLLAVALRVNANEEQLYIDADDGINCHRVLVNGAHHDIEILKSSDANEHSLFQALLFKGNQLKSALLSDRNNYKGILFDKVQEYKAKCLADRVSKYI